AVAGFGGMRDYPGALTFAPRLPEALTRLAFRLTYLGRLLKVEVNHRQATYSLLDGPALDISHHGEGLTVTTAGSVTRPVPTPPVLERPVQPLGRAPARRSTAPTRDESKEPPGSAIQAGT